MPSIHNDVWWIRLDMLTQQMSTEIKRTVSIEKSLPPRIGHVHSFRNLFQRTWKHATIKKEVEETHDEESERLKERKYVLLSYLSYYFIAAGLVYMYIFGLFYFASITHDFPESNDNRAALTTKST